MAIGCRESNLPARATEEKPIMMLVSMSEHAEMATDERHKTHMQHVTWTVDHDEKHQPYPKFLRDHGAYLDMVSSYLWNKLWAIMCRFYGDFSPWFFYFIFEKKSEETLARAKLFGGRSARFFCRDNTIFRLGLSSISKGRLRYVGRSI